MGRRPITIHTLALFLTAMLAWPWNLALSSIEVSSPHASPVERSTIRPKRSNTGKRFVRALRWDAAVTPAFMEDDEESSDEGDDAETPVPFFYHFSMDATHLPLLTRVQIAYPSISLHSRPLASLCRLRC